MKAFAGYLHLSLLLYIAESLLWRDSRHFAWIRGCLTSIPECPIHVNRSWVQCPSIGCHRQRIINGHYGRLLAHE